MYTFNKMSGRVRLDGKLISRDEADALPKSKKFSTPAGPCVVVAKNMEERVALVNATCPEDIEGYEEALQEVQA